MIGDFRFEDGGVEIGKEAVEMEEGDPNCYDSAAMEAFWSTLKRHAMAQSATWSKNRVRRELLEYIEGDYNRSRLQSSE